MLKFFTGFIAGVLVVALVIGLGGYFLLTGVSVNTLEGWFKVDLTPGENNPNADKSILDMGKMIIATVQNIPKTSLNDLKTEYGIDVIKILKNKFGDKDLSFLDGIMTCGLGSIPDEIKKIQLGNFMKLVSVEFSPAIEEILSPLLTASVNDMITGTGTNTIIQNVINGISVEQINDIDPNLLPASIPLFKDPLHKKDKLVDIFSEISKVDGTIKLKDILNIEATAPYILKTLGETSIGGLETKIQALKVSDVFDITDPTTSPVLVELKDENLLSLAGTFDQKIKTIKIGSIIGAVPTNSFLYELKDSTLDTINTDILNKVSGANLSKLKEWGILPSTLNTDKVIGGKKLGDMNLLELVNIINNIPDVPVIPSTQAA